MKDEDGLITMSNGRIISSDNESIVENWNEVIAMPKMTYK